MLGTPGAFTSGNDMQDFMAVAMGGAEAAPRCSISWRLATPSQAGGLRRRWPGDRHRHHHPHALRSDVRHAGFALSHAVHRSGACPGSRLEPACASRMGHQKAFALLAAGIPFSGEDAERAGLIYKTVSPPKNLSRQCSPQPNIWRRSRRRRSPSPAAWSSRIPKSGGRPDARGRPSMFSNQLKSAEALAAFQAFMARKK
jgi:hypothetical protein